MNRKLWTANRNIDPEVEAFTVGDDPNWDQRLLPYDCLASKAHAEMLADMGVLSPTEWMNLSSELDKIAQMSRQGEFEIRLEDEDAHTAIENHLVNVLGETGKKIHTYRSRNDQVLAALRLYYREKMIAIVDAAASVIAALNRFGGVFGHIPMPGFTHSRKAMPSSVGLWAHALIAAFEDDRAVLTFHQSWIDQCPLGSGAGYGVGIALDRARVAQRLGFSRVQENSLYVQNSRGKFEAGILHALSLVMMDLNRASTDLILFSMPEFGFFELPTSCLTGSSIMPQKKNPDVLEILRASAHTVIASELEIKTLVGNLISGYNRDVQLTKGPTMKGLDTALQSLRVFEILVNGLRVNPVACEAAMSPDLYAADRAFQLVKSGMPFRDAYDVVASEFRE